MATQDDAPQPLSLVEDHRDRIEQYELRGPDGYVVEVEHNIDSGEFTYRKTTRTELSEDASS